MSATLIKLLLTDHEETRALMAGFDDLPKERREEAFWALVATLVKHEVAVEEVLYPAVRKYVDGGDDLAGKRLDEQSEAERLLVRMERELKTEVAFMQNFANLRDAVLEHAEAEEQTVFPELASVLDQNKLVELGERYELAKASAPTHPHPHIPDSPPGDVFVGAVAALVDKVRDAVRKAS